MNSFFRAETRPRTAGDRKRHTGLKGQAPLEGSIQKLKYGHGKLAWLSSTAFLTVSNPNKGGSFFLISHEDCGNLLITFRDALMVGDGWDSRIDEINSLTIRKDDGKIFWRRLLSFRQLSREDLKSAAKLLSQFFEMRPELFEGLKVKWNRPSSRILARKIELILEETPGISNKNLAAQLGEYFVCNFTTSYVGYIISTEVYPNNPDLKERRRVALQSKKS